MTYVTKMMIGDAIIGDMDILMKLDVVEMEKTVLILIEMILKTYVTSMKNNMMQRLQGVLLDFFIAF